MTIPRQKLREAAFQMLFSLDGGGECDAIVEMIMDQLKITRSAARAARDYAVKVFNGFSELDTQIDAASKDYATHRISAVERNVLRLAIYEICFETELPPKVAIAEAIRLARKFSSSEGARFVNAVLDEIYQKRLSGGDES